MEISVVSIPADFGLRTICTLYGAVIVESIIEPIHIHSRKTLTIGKGFFSIPTRYDNMDLMFAFLREITLYKLKVKII